MYCNIIPYFLLCGTICFTCSLKAATLDFLTGNYKIILSMNNCKQHFRFNDSTPEELVCYNKQNTFLGYSVQEAIMRFSPQKQAISGDFLIFASIKRSHSPVLHKIKNDLIHKLNHKLSSPEKKKLNIEGKIVEIFCWENTHNRIYMFCSTLCSHHDEVIFVSVRWETTAHLKNKYLSWRSQPNYQLKHEIAPGVRKLLVPHRKQSELTGRCATTTMSRQLAYYGSEIPPVIFAALFADKNSFDKIKFIETRFNYNYKSTHFNKASNVKENCLYAIDEYNKLAAKFKRPQIKKEKLHNNIDAWGDNFVNSDPVIWNRLKKVERKGYKKFRKYVISNINKNIPIGWTVNRHTGKTRHRRMITGYDLNKDIIFFSDTWGNGAKTRSMPFLAAYMQTVWTQIIY